MVGPTADAMAFENALPGHACPPPGHPVELDLVTPRARKADQGDVGGDRLLGRCRPASVALRPRRGDLGDRRTLRRLGSALPSLFRSRRAISSRLATELPCSPVRLDREALFKWKGRVRDGLGHFRQRMTRFPMSLREQPGSGYFVLLGRVSALLRARKEPAGARFASSNLALLFSSLPLRILAEFGRRIGAVESRPRLLAVAARPRPPYGSGTRCCLALSQCPNL